MMTHTAASPAAASPAAASRARRLAPMPAADPLWRRRGEAAYRGLNHTYARYRLQVTSYKL